MSTYTEKKHFAAQFISEIFNGFSFAAVLNIIPYVYK